MSRRFDYMAFDDETNYHNNGESWNMVKNRAESFLDSKTSRKLGSIAVDMLDLVE